MAVIGFIACLLVVLYLTFVAILAIRIGGLDLGPAPAVIAIPAILAVIGLWYLLFMFAPFEITVN